MNTRARILEAANAVAMRDGVLHLTLEAVATEANVSKGGLLYHFPNKAALVAGLVAQFIDEFEVLLPSEESDESSAADNVGSTDAGSFTRAFINATFREFPAPPRLSAALFAAIALNPNLLEGLEDTFATWHKRVENDGLDPTLASLLRYAADGIWISELLGLAPPDQELRERLHRLMLDLTRDEKSP